MDKLNYEMVEYSKEFATVTAGLDAYELDILLILTYMARQKVRNNEVDTNDDLKIALSSKELKKILRYTGSANPKRMEKVIKKLFDTKYYFRKDNYIIAHHIFEELRFSLDKDEVILVLKKKYINLLFKLSGNFTQHKILEFNSLKGKYSKRIYQIIMSYKDFKSWELDVDIFRMILEIPKSYGWGDIDKCLKPVFKEFKEKTDIKNFKMEKIKSGRAITKVKFTWNFNDKEEVEEVKEEMIEDLELKNVGELTESEINLFNLLRQFAPDKYPMDDVKEGTDLYTFKVKMYLERYYKETKKK